MTNRQSRILLGLVKMYIDTARPISSGALTHSLKLPLSPATVRAIFNDLEKEEYTYQPHVSAGRIPTDKGYRFYVNHLTSLSPSKNQKHAIRTHFTKQPDYNSNPLHTIAALLAHYTNSYAVAGYLQNQHIEHSGLSTLLNWLDEEKQTAVFETLSFTDFFYSHIKYLQKLNQPRLAIYIGCENPFMSAQHTSIIIRTVPQAKNLAFCLIIGPKRMPYQKNIPIIEACSNLLTNQ